MTTTDPGTAASAGSVPRASTPSEAETWMLLTSLVFDQPSTWRSQVTELTGMPFSRFRALRRLESGPLIGAEIADRLSIDAPAASVIIADLVERGLVSKRADPADGRRKLVALTDSGRELLASVRSATGAPVIGVLDEHERRALHTLLLKMQEAAK